MAAESFKCSRVMTQLKEHKIKDLFLARKFVVTQKAIANNDLLPRENFIQRLHLVLLTRIRKKLKFEGC